MNNIETKKIDLKVKGKKGFVNANYIQRHKPDANMVFIQFDLDPYMLFCQENHPVIIYERLEDGDYLEHIIEAKDVRKGDLFYIDISQYREQRMILESDTDIEEIRVKHFYEELNNYINYQEKLNDNFYKNKFGVIVGDDKYNLCFSQKVIENYSNNWFHLFFTLISSKQYNGKLLEFYSFNFVSQLAILAYSMNMSLRFEFNKENCSWTVVSYDPNLNNLNDYMLWSDNSFDDINYSPVYNVVKDIDNFNGYVYDIKTETGEFINNGVQTHNSFHCFHKDSKVKIKTKTVIEYKSLEKIWNESDREIEEKLFTNNMLQWEKDVSNDEMFVYDIKDTWYAEGNEYTKILKIIRHKQDPSTKMIHIKTVNGFEIISQSNHKHFTLCDWGDIIEKSAEKFKIGDSLFYFKDDRSIRTYVQSVDVVDNIPDDEYVYDLTTETGRLYVNGILTHNTGGAVEFKKINILKELADSISTEDETHLARMVTQKDTDLYSNTNLIVINIDKKLFKDEFKIEEESDRYKLPLGYFNMRVGTIEINATIEMPVEIFKSNDVEEDDDKIHIMYGNGEKLFFIKFFKIAPEKIAAGIDNLVAGKSPWKKPEDLLKKFHENLAQFGNYDMTHLEVLIGTILRNKKDPMIPARLKEPYDPETHSIKSLPSLVSWSLGIAYENIGRSLSYGLISQDTKNLSSIEKVLFGEPLSDLSIDLLKEKKLKRR